MENAETAFATRNNRAISLPFSQELSGSNILNLVPHSR